MNSALQEAIKHMCRKKVTRMKRHDEEEEDEMEHEEIDELEEIESLESLPFQDILADKRRKYSPKDEFTYLLYNDLLKYIIKSWDGAYLRKKSRKKFDQDSGEETYELEDFEETENNKDEDKFPEKENNVQESYYFSEFNINLPWKLSQPDEYANITFINNNTYSGRISRKMMEGEGVYRWSNGVQYKGEFQHNRIHGKGLLEWNNNCWYEGGFANGHRHGRGIIVNGDNRYMYAGLWCMGQKHGKGYCRYGNNGSYDGDWIMGKMNGIGLRIYPKGARYFGQWKNGLRNGTGTMVWTNGSVYRGEWKCGAMNGYGELTWNGFLNKTLTWPQEASYVGDWREGKRHGKGLLKLNSIGGAKYSGYWKDDKKHGPGIIFGNNGEKYEAEPLFFNDILVSPEIADTLLKHQLTTQNRKKCVRMREEVKPMFFEEPKQLGKAPIVPILKPEQLPSLTYYITRLLDPQSLEPLLHSVPSGMCYSCENKSCACLIMHSSDTITSVEKVQQPPDTGEPSVGSKIESEWKYEERWTNNCLKLHMPRLRGIYKYYAKLFATSAPKCELIMSRLCLWQLWRDCGINKKGLNIAEIDDYLAMNKSSSIENPCDPFEKIQVWQLLHALLEVSWHLYTKYDDFKLEDMNGRLASGLHKLLKNDIYPRAGNRIGSLYYQYQDLLPMNCVLEYYKKIGYPLSAKDLLRVLYTIRGTPDPQTSSTSNEPVNQFPDGINSVTIGDTISYLLKFDRIFTPPHCRIHCLNKYTYVSSANELLELKQLGTAKLVEIMATVCPGIKDGSSGVIINMDYKLTFLEFYEILLEATGELLLAMKKAEGEVQLKNLDAESVRLENNNLQGRTSRTARHTSAQKSYKSKTNIP